MRLSKLIPLLNENCVDHGRIDNGEDDNRMVSAKVQTMSMIKSVWCSNWQNTNTWNAPSTANLGRHLGHGLHVRDRPLHLTDAPAQIHPAQVEAGRFARKGFLVRCSRAGNANSNQLLDRQSNAGIMSMRFHATLSHRGPTFFGAL